VHRGGNDPAIIFPDVDVDKVAEKVAFYTFLNSGQVRRNPELLNA
jgi:acyl-CoA reductase-like NAD-dependent aldehyde dehydrogenase